MKIVCDACQAKYSISDDKVQGKVFKIRCKKCSNIIVVRGGASAAEPAPQPQQEKDTRVYDYGYEGGDRAPAGDEAVWHVVVNQDQVGPMTAVEVQQRFAGGDIDAETYIWREGFTDWLPLAQVDTFAGLLASAPASAPAPRGGGSEAVASMFAAGEDAGGARNDPGDLFAAASASSAHHDDDGGDLFGGKPVAAPAAAAGAKLRGERNENSVLFSLNNLAQLASDKPAPAPRAPMASGAPVGAATGAAGSEGSGLIDIRSMANAYLGAPGGAPKPASAGIGSIDDLPVFGGGGFTEPAVIVPIAARSNSNKLLYALIGSVGLLAVAAVIVVIVMFKGGGDKAGTQVAQAGKSETAAAEPPKTEAAKAPATPEPATDVKAAGAGATEPKAAGAGATEPKAAGSVDNKVATADAPPEPKHPAPVPTPTAHKVAAAAGSTPAAAKAPAKSPEKAPAPPAPSREPAAAPKGDSGGCDEVSCVLSSYDGACCAKFKKGGGKSATPSGGGTAPKSGGGDVPDGLDRAMIADGVAKVKPRVTGCSSKSPAKGIVKISVRVGSDGHVTSVTVKETPDAALGDCVAGIMRGATFARTQNGGSFAYPFPF